MPAIQYNTIQSVRRQSAIACLQFLHCLGGDAKGRTWNSHMALSLLLFIKKIERHATTPSSTNSLSILLSVASHIGRLIFAMRQQ